MGQNLFFTEKIAFFLKNMSFQQPLRCYKTDPIIPTVFASIPFLTYFLSPEVCQTRWNEKKLVKIFSSLENLPLFQNIVFSTTTLVLQNWYYTFHSKCQIDFWTLKKFDLRFSTPDRARKFGSKTFVTVKTAVFWKFCFYGHLRSQKMILTIAQYLAKNFLGP